MNRIKYILVLTAVLFSVALSAQDQRSMRINEILVTNTDDFQDDFGKQNAWIELFNTSYGTVDIGGCFFSNDRNNLKMYIIPKGDVLTKIKPRQHTLFWADNSPFRGTFHVNFTLAESDSVFFVSSDGRTIIDVIPVPAELKGEAMINKSFGREEDGNDNLVFLERTSPSTNNSGVDEVTKSMKMAQMDPYGWILTILAMLVVFSALIILALIFTGTAKLSVRKSSKNAEAAGAPAVKSPKDATSAETFAAIAMALHLYNEENEAHDEESFDITLSHTDRTYSPWSSKIYGLRQLPQIRKK